MKLFSVDFFFTSVFNSCFFIMSDIVANESNLIYNDFFKLNLKSIDYLQCDCLPGSVFLKFFLDESSFIYSSLILCQFSTIS